MKSIGAQHVYRRKDHDGIWALKNHRLRGLVLLSESFTDRGSWIVLKRGESRSQLVWEVHIDSLVGPFRNHQHRIFDGPYSDRRNFRAAYGQDMTSHELNEGEEILKAMYGAPLLGIHTPSRNANGFVLNSLRQAP